MRYNRKKGETKQKQKQNKPSSNPAHICRRISPDESEPVRQVTIDAPCLSIAANREAESSAKLF